MSQPALYTSIMEEILHLMRSDPSIGSFDGKRLFLLGCVAEQYEREMCPDMFAQVPAKKRACELTHMEALTALLDAEYEVIRLRALRYPFQADPTPPPEGATP